MTQTNLGLHIEVWDDDNMTQQKFEKNSHKCVSYENY
jgi:hypothetical protein